MTKIVQDVSKLRTPLTELPKNKAEQDVLGAALLTQLKKNLLTDSSFMLNTIFG